MNLCAAPFDTRCDECTEEIPEGTALAYMLFLPGLHRTLCVECASRAVEQAYQNARRLVTRES